MDGQPPALDPLEFFPQPSPAAQLAAFKQWAALNDGDRVQLSVLIMDLGGSSPIPREIAGAEATEITDRFRTLVESTADEWCVFPLKDWAGDQTALFFGEDEHALGCAFDLMARTRALRAELAKAQPALGAGTARGYRIAVASGKVVFRRRPGTASGVALNIAGHMLKACPAPGLIVKQDLLDQATKPRRALFQPGPAVRHDDLFVATAVPLGQEPLAEGAAGEPSPGDDADDAAFDEALKGYLRWVESEYDRTRLLGGTRSVEREGGAPLPLTRIYTSLTATRQRGGQVTPGIAGEEPGGEDVSVVDGLDMEELLTLGPRVAIVGGAGSGKTTYSAFVASALAGALLGRPRHAKLRIPDPDGEPPIPLVVPLRNWNRYRELVESDPLVLFEKAGAGTMEDFIAFYLKGASERADTPWPPWFVKRLLSSPRTLLMFDGLDEVVSAHERVLVRDEIGKLLRHRARSGARCLVTSRRAGWEDAPFVEGFVRCDVSPHPRPGARAVCAPS